VCLRGSETFSAPPSLVPLDKPLVAGFDGVIAGTDFELAAVADRALVTERAYLGRADPLLGTGPGVRRILPFGMHARLALLGDDLLFPASAAAACGYRAGTSTRSWASQHLRTRAVELARSLAGTKRAR
jgi:enoyl-CoA hydratase/carnithine racemase